MNEKVMAIFLSHLKKVHNLTLYDYQKDIAWRIFDALLQNMRLTLNATEEDIKKLKRVEIPIEISRQAGKTTDIVAIINYILIFFTQMFHKELQTGIFAPQREQSKTDFDRLKLMLSKDTTFTVINHEAEVRAKEESNSKTLVLPNGSSCYVFPVSKTSKPESKTLDLIIVEEAQDVDDTIVKEQIWPMGASTNAPIIYIGTAGTRLCHFRRLGMKPGAIKKYFYDIVADRRKVYEETGDVKHLIYEQNVKQLIEEYGLESDEVQRPFFGKWLIGTGQFTVMEELDALVADRGRTHQEKKSDCYAGLDTAKHPDSTVVTILRDNHETNKRELINWMELRGDNYKSQFEIIVEFLKRYNIKGIAIDSTGQGDFMPDMFESETEWRDEHSGLYRVKFSAVSKDNMYKNLKVVIKESLTTLPKLDTKEAEKFRQQMLDLQQEYKGQLLSVHHPDSPDAHDDYPDSWALAEWAYAEGKQHELNYYVVTGEKERKVDKNEDGQVENYWPGDDFE